MLAQILPGFRDFRTPLITGYLWLLSLWILLGKPIPTKDRKDGLMGMANALGDYLSGPAVLVVLSFLAYIIGMLLAVEIKWVTRLVQRYGWTKRRTSFSSRLRNVRLISNSELDEYERLVATHSGLTMRQLLWDAFKRVEKRLVPWETIYEEYGIEHPDKDSKDAYFSKWGGDSTEIDKSLGRDGLGYVAPELLSDMEREIPTLATKLQEKNKDLYESYGREKSEAEFRLSVSLPIAVASILTLVCGLSSNPTLNASMGTLGLVAAVVLFTKGWSKSKEATNVIITAVEIGVIQSKVLERLDGLRGPQILTEMGDPVIR